VIYVSPPIIHLLVQYPLLVFTSSSFSCLSACGFYSFWGFWPLSAADPTADVEGHDVRAKIALVAKLAYGVSVPVEQIPCKGISSITR